jgi:hypothetical protein
MRRSVEWILINSISRAKSVPIGSSTAQRQTPVRLLLQFLHSALIMSLLLSLGTSSLPSVEPAMIQKTVSPTNRETAFPSTRRCTARLVGSKALKRSQTSLRRTPAVEPARSCWSSLATMRLPLSLQARLLGRGEMSGAFCKIHDAHFHFHLLLSSIEHFLLTKCVIAKLSLSTKRETTPRRTQQTPTVPRFALIMARTLDTIPRPFSSTMLEVTSPLRTCLVQTSCLVWPS